MNYEFIFLLFIIIYCYYLIFYIDKTKNEYNIIKNVILNRSILFLIIIFIIFGLFGLYNKSLTMITNILSFVIPMSLIMIDI
jgi:hypothetical protein